MLGGWEHWSDCRDQWSHSTKFRKKIVIKEADNGGKPCSLFNHEEMSYCDNGIITF